MGFACAERLAGAPPELLASRSSSAQEGPTGGTACSLGRKGAQGAYLKNRLDVFTDGAIIEFFVNDGEKATSTARAAVSLFGIGVAASGAQPVLALRDPWRISQSALGSEYGPVVWHGHARRGQAKKEGEAVRLDPSKTASLRPSHTP